MYMSFLYFVVLNICLSWGGNQQRDSKTKFQALQTPGYPTFQNESWPALTIPCHQPAHQIWPKIVYQIMFQVNQYINCVQQSHKSIRK